MSQEEIGHGAGGRKSVMILGGGVMQLPAIRTAGEEGWRSFVVDGNPACPGADAADQFAHVDLRDLDGLVEAAREYRSGNGLDGVFTAGTDFSTSVAYVAEALGLPGIPYRTALDASDKFRMRTRFTEAGVPCPPFVGILSEQRLGTAVARCVSSLTFPVVVKPVDNMGARGVIRVSTETALESALAAARTHSKTGRVIVEEFIEGDEFSLDAIVYRGEVTVCGVADRHIFFPPYFVEMGHTMPTARGMEERSALETVFEQGIKALGIKNGAAKGDIFLGKDGAMVGEIAARLSGGYMSGWTFPYASGIGLTRAAMRISLGMEPGELAALSNRVSAERAFISIPGKIAAIHGVHTVRHLLGVKEFFLQRHDGDEVRFPQNNVEKCGNIITVGESREQATATATKALQEIRVELAPGRMDTIEFLFHPEAEDSRWAFLLQDDRNRHAFGEMTCGTAGGGEETVAMLPEIERERIPDWSGRTLSDVIAELGEMHNLIPVPPQVGVRWGAELWQALLRGGLQGGIFLIDTINDAQSAAAQEYIRAWCQGRTPTDV